MKRRISVIGAILVATFSVLIACSGNVADKAPTTTGGAERIGSGHVGAAGGAVASADGTAATVEIPAGALTSDHCGACPAMQSCGGGGVPSKCG